MDRLNLERYKNKKDVNLIVVDTINEFADTTNEDIAVSDIIEAVKEFGVNEKEVWQTIEKIKKMGDLFEPKHNYIRTL